MKRIIELAGREAKWTQPSAFNMNYELVADDQPSASLRFRSLCGSLATGESADGCWTFKRVGFFQTRVTVRACGEEADTAVFRNNTWSGGGTLELSDGRKVLATTNLWQTNLEFKTESGESLLRFRSGGLIHLSAGIEIPQRAFGLAELPWLVMLGWYLIVMINMDAATSAAVIG